MSDMKTVLAPKTDQINFDHFSGGRSITIKITGYKFTSGDQPVEFTFENSNGKVFRPCKSMGRVMVAAWGDKASAYIGRSLTLYGDPKVKFGGMEVGGVRISHMSDIDRDLTVSLTTTKANRRPYTVKPLIITKQAEGATNEKVS